MPATGWRKPIPWPWGWRWAGKRLTGNDLSFFSTSPLLLKQHGAEAGGSIECRSVSMEVTMQQILADCFQTAMTDVADPELAAQSLASQLLHPHLGFVLFFCSAHYPLERLGAALEQHFGGVMLVGCTTAGEITPQGYGRGCISAVGFDCRAFAIDSTLISALDDFSLVDAQAVVDRMLNHCRQARLAPIKGHTFALTLLDGLSSREEVVLATLGATLGSIPHFGGSAGGDDHPVHTYVYYQGPLPQRRGGGGDGQYLARLRGVHHPQPAGQGREAGGDRRRQRPPHSAGAECRTRGAGVRAAGRRTCGAVE